MSNILKDSQVIGFFSLPSPSLAEHNPEAYNLAMAGAPEGAGSCAHCGTGIRHNVVIRTADGKTAFIGTDCASRIGGDVARCVSLRATSEQVAKRDALNAAQVAKWDAERLAREAYWQARREQFADVIACLKSQQTQFHNSLAEQLVCGDLSDRQTNYVLKAFFGRCNKRNQSAWNELADKLEGIEASVS